MEICTWKQSLYIYSRFIWLCFLVKTSVFNSKWKSLILLVIKLTGAGSVMGNVGSQEDLISSIFLGAAQTHLLQNSVWKRLELWIPVQNNSGLLGLCAHAMPNYLLRGNREPPWPKLPKDKALPQSWLSLGLSSINCNQGEQEVCGCGRALKGNNEGTWERYIMIRRLFPAF